MCFGTNYSPDTYGNNAIVRERLIAIVNSPCI